MVSEFLVINFHFSILYLGSCLLSIEYRSYIIFKFRYLGILAPIGSSIYDICLITFIAF